MAKRVLEQLAKIVSRNELFEQPGDRPRQPVLDKDAWKGPGGDAKEAGE